RTTGNGFISFIALVSMLGIALGVAALIVVLSVMNGFQKEVRDRMLSVLAHVEVFSPTGSMPDWQLTAQEARAAETYVIPPLKLARGDAAARLAVAPHRESGEMLLGGQEQFYLEGQIAYAVPKDDDGMHVYCSTQHPSEMQHLVAHVLGVASHNVLVECRRMGGGFGGKESQSGLFACCAALAAWKLLCPVKLRPDRDDDMMITGKRHDFHY
ncbi:molybdopterin-dependent oxidoreductase, partial [Staphylococcus lugdunensis]|nr:molybdopterin-dependent oxidoreductase [Staphylococcus lugdunensis]